MAPGIASKLLGKASFSATGLYSRVGRAALRPVVERCYADAPPGGLSNTLRRALLYIDALFRRLPPRVLLVRPSTMRAVVIASDAQAELANPSAGAILLGGTHDLCSAVYGRIQEEVLECWGYGTAVRQRMG